MAPQTAARAIDTSLIDAETIADYQRDGAVCIRGAFKGWVDTIAAGIERNMQNRSATASDIANGRGSFFDDYCNWERIPEFVEVVRKSPAAQIAAAVMQSRTAQFFHDHGRFRSAGSGLSGVGLIRRPLNLIQAGAIAKST